jgi:hypothetical protein
MLLRRGAKMCTPAPGSDGLSFPGRRVLEELHDLGEVSERVVRLYDKANQPEKARAWREKLAVHAIAAARPKSEGMEPALVSSTNPIDE